MPRFLKLESIKIGERQRSEIERAKVLSMRDSIAHKGLFHAPVVAIDEAGNYKLVVGRTRLLAIEELHKEKRPFFYDGHLVPENEAPVVEVTDLSFSDLMEAELEENVIRFDLSWQDRARAIAAIHEQRQRENPKQTRSQTADELSSKGGPVGVSHPEAVRRVVRESVVLAAHLHKPSVSKARNANEALQIVLKDEGAALEAELIKRRLTTAPLEGKGIEVRHGNCLEILPSLKAGTFDLVLVDPPYGIGADSGGFRSRTVQHHNYDDKPDTVRPILQSLITDGFRLCKSRANIFIFTDIGNWDFLQTVAGQMGWVPWRTPLIWQKSETEGMAPWGSLGFRRTYEMIFYATKGQKGLLRSPVDILEHKRVPRHERVYGPEKPIPLLKQLIEISTLPGDFILDPCCGAGSTLVAARQLRRRALGVELSEAGYNLALVAAQRDVEEEEPELPIGELA